MEQKMMGQDRIGQDRAGQDRAGQDRAGQERTEQNTTQQKKTKRVDRKLERADEVHQQLGWIDTDRSAPSPFSTLTHTYAHTLLAIT